MAECDADVLVVGAGGAGLAAAVGAAERGARVLVVEQGDAPGGKTALAMGSLTASETRFQRAAGIADSNAAHREDILAHLARNGRTVLPDDPSPDLVVSEGASIADWLAGLGVQFSGPHPERPHSAYRMHNAIPDGSAYTKALLAALARHGVQVLCNRRVTSLTRDGDDYVAEWGDGPRRVGAVVLAAGDWSAAVDRFVPGAEPVVPLRDWARGDGQALAQSLGAELRGMDRPTVPVMRFADPPYTEPDNALYAAGAIMVDPQGARVDRPGEAFGKTPAIRAADALWAVFGAEVAERIATAADDAPSSRDGWRRLNRLFICTAPGRGYDYLADTLQRQGCGQGDTPAALADAVGIDPAGLTRTIQALQGERAAAPDGPPAPRPPYYALGPLRARLLLTEGGARVDDQLRVLRADGSAIPGLYAAGGAAVNAGWAGAHGLSLGWAFISGRRAGSNAAQEARAAG